ncbi:monocarboxylate transporter 7-like [Epargyreus clarus]|uniref:monocarboxylate transporter 7-like n=1 Tax=Epargyreus clarus TaxID=520877 RepID=UPI003C2E8FEE
MPPKPILVKNETKKNVVITPSRVVSRPDNLEGGEEIEIAAQISVPQEGGWGWVVVIACFISICILDGVTFTFGSMLPDIASDFNISDSLVALVNSIAVAIYFIAGPLASAFINRFGFRACIMSGSVLSSFSLLTSYFVTNYASLCVFYGGFAGFGYCLINMSSGLVVGFYFEKLRSLALAIATCGSSVGTMTFFPLNSYLVKLAGWRTTTLLHSGLFGLIYFLGMTFQPLLSLTVVQTTDDPTRTVTYLPNLSTVGLQRTVSGTKADTLLPTATERLFSAVSNANFPTAANVVGETKVTSDTQPGPSNAPVSKLTLTVHSPHGGISQRHLKQVQSIISRTSVHDKSRRNMEINIQMEKPKKIGCWARLCHWEEHIPQSRPMYRDDAFYDGKLEKLPVYQKSMMETKAEGKTGLEYQLAVSRAATAVDLQERRGVFTTAARRVLATMMDPKLLKKNSFIFLCMAGFLVYLGFLVPFVFIPYRNESAGIDPSHCVLFVSAISLANVFGRLILGALACKVEPLRIFIFSILIAGISTILSDLSYNLYYQYTYCFIFGFFISSIASLRSMVLVSLYGLDNLTNATGVMLLFQGIGSLISTPIAGILKNNFGYSVSFYIAGAFITFGAFFLIPVKSMSLKENNIDSDSLKQPDTNIDIKSSK